MSKRVFIRHLLMRSLEYREVIRMLGRHDGLFAIYLQRGKRSQRMLVHPSVSGSRKTYPLPYRGDKTRIRPGMLKDLIRKFDLPAAIFGR